MGLIYNKRSILHEVKMLQIVYLILCFLGSILPYSQFLPFLAEQGFIFEPMYFFELAFTNKVAGFFSMDVIVSSLVLWTLVFWEGSRLNMKHLWIYIASNLLVGVSLGLPLFLLMRQRKLEEMLN
jgi:hypothetical protein